MYSMNTLRVTLLGITCLLGTAASFRTQGPAASGAVTRVGVIGMLQAISSTAEGKQAAADLKSQFAPRQQEMKSLDNQIGDVQKRLESGRGTLSDEEKARLNDQGNRLAQRLDRRRREYQEDLSAAQAEIVSSLETKMMDVLNRYAQENNYAAILDSSAQNSPVLYASKNIDVTQDIVRLYDQAHPAKATAPPAKPAQAPSKPTTAPPGANPQ